FASTGTIKVANGSAIETRGTISGSSGDLRLLPSIDRAVDTKGTATTSDDVVIHEALDQGTLLRLSSAEQVDILRNVAAIDAMAALRGNPSSLAAVNAARVAAGLAPLLINGNLTVSDGARLSSSQSMALDATTDTRVGVTATLGAKQLSA